MKKFICTVLTAALMAVQCPVIHAEKEVIHTITNPRVEGFAEQMGVSTAPTFSWGYTSGDEAKYQTAYRLIIRDNSGAEAYDSGKVDSPMTQGISIEKNLEPSTKYMWDLHTWFDSGEENESLGNTFVTGIADWKGKWISGGSKPFYARQSFDVEKELSGAYAHVCGLGQFKLFLNGKKVGNHEIDPGWTDYDDSDQYVTFDITDMINSGENVVGVSVGNGWYLPQRDAGHFYFGNEMHFGDELALICDIALEYVDGSREVIATDESWRVHDSATTVANVYGTEFFDARLYPDGWDNVGFDDSKWNSASLISGPKGQLVPQYQPPVTVKKVYDDISVDSRSSTYHIFDMGQNMSGQFEVYVSGPAGSEVAITPVEKLNSSGDVERTASTWMKYTLKGTGGIEVWKPDFTYAGGRWVLIEGAELGDTPVEGKTVIHDVRAYYLTNSAREVGSFSASDERYNAVFDLILSAMESNLQSVHTDCPTIERLGWMETSQLMAPSIIYNKDARELLRKIARDAAEAQYENGFIPDVAPSYPRNAFNGAYWDSPAWGSAGIIAPWLLYEYYGDTASLNENYEAMKKYAAYLKSKEDENGMLMHGLGDWGIAPPDGTRSEANMETGLYYWDLRILRDTAEMLGYTEDAVYFASEVERVKKNYNDTLLVKNEDNGLYVYRDLSRQSVYDFDPEHYVSYGNYVQGNQAMPLFLDDIIPDYAKDDIVKSFKIALEIGAITTGEISQRFIMQMATKYGLTEVIHNKVTSSKLGGYYRFVQNGETTLPEFWEDAARSRNHDMLGHAMEWFYNGVGGIFPETPGFETVRIAPRPPQVLESANVEYDSVKGNIVSSWTHTSGSYNLHIELPANTNGVISIPTFGMTDMTITSGGDVLYSGGEGQSADGITFVSDGDGITFKVKNGCFDFKLIGNEPLPDTSDELLYFEPSASSDINNYGWTLAASVDGNTDSNDSAKGWSSNGDTDRNHDEWYMLDFGKVQTVSRLDLYPRNDTGYVGQGFPIDFRIEVSDDEQDWTVLIDEKDYPYPAPSGVQSFPLGKTDCRYIRIYATKIGKVDGYRMQLAEVEAYNDSSVYRNSLNFMDISDVDSVVSGKVFCSQPGDYNVYCASYDRSGSLMDVKSQAYSFDKTGTADFSAETEVDAATVNIYGWNTDMAPAMDKLNVVRPLARALTSSVGQHTESFHSLRTRTKPTEYSFTLSDKGSVDSGILLGSSSYLNSGSGNYFASSSMAFMFGKGIIYIREPSDTAKKEVGRYSPDEELNIRILADIPDNIYSIYVNGESVAENVIFRTSATSVDKLALVENGGGSAFEITDFEMGNIVDYELERYLTDYKYGLPALEASGVQGAYDEKSVDCPFVFYHNDKYYMMHVGFDGQGYQTALSTSDDLLHWSEGTVIFPRSEDVTGWDRTGVAGMWILKEDSLDGTPELKKVDGKYWMIYHSYPSAGYESGPAQIGLAYTEDEELLNWTRLDEPILSWKDGGAWEQGGLYKGCLIENDGTYYLFYNAKQKDSYPWNEQIGLATSTDLLHWERAASTPVLRNGVGTWDRQFCADPFVVRDGDLWVMYYYGFDGSHAAEGIAFSNDLIHWEKEPKPIITPGAECSIDYYHAHKPSVLKKDGVLYHFYCAVRESRDTDKAFNPSGSSAEFRCITVAASESLE